MNEKQASVAARIAELACLPMSELWTVWDRYFPRRPDYPNRTHVESRLAYKLQEEAFGGLAPERKTYAVLQWIQTAVLFQNNGCNGRSPAS